MLGKQVRQTLAVSLTLLFLAALTVLTVHTSRRLSLAVCLCRLPRALLLLTLTLDASQPARANSCTNAGTRVPGGPPGADGAVQRDWRRQMEAKRLVSDEAAVMWRCGGAVVQ